MATLRSIRAGASPRRRSGLGLCDAVALDELANLVDYREGIQIALALRFTPGKQPVTAEHDAIASGILLAPPRIIRPSSKPGRCHGTHTS